MPRPPSMDLRAHVPFEQWRDGHVMRCWEQTPTAEIDAALQLWNAAYFAATVGLGVDAGDVIERAA